MTHRVLKYVLQPERRQMIHMPLWAKPIAVAEQQEQLVMWVEVEEGDAEQWIEPRIFVVLTTGDRFEADGKHYIGTAILKGWYVAHVYEQEQGHPDPVDETRADDLKQLREDATIREIMDDA
jgi:hypothetical protein